MATLIAILGATKFKHQCDNSFNSFHNDCFHTFVRKICPFSVSQSFLTGTIIEPGHVIYNNVAF